MARTVKLLLVENVDNLGIVGDVVTVKPGYARNFLLPRALATRPSEELVKELAGKRAEAEKLLAKQRKDREALIQKIDGLEMTLTRACNDQGQLYGSVTQNDIADALTTLGFPVKAREVRLPGSIKRVENYEVLVKFASDLEATVTVYVVADRELESDDDNDMEFDNEGNLIDRSGKKNDAARNEGSKPEAADAKA